MSEALALSNVSITRGGVPILTGVSLRIEPGQAMVLRGGNGAGKTTLLRAIAGLQPIAAGEISGPEAAYAGHADGIKFALTVRENLAFWAEVFDTNKIDAALEAFDLANLAERAAAALSAGQKRRLGLARLCVSGRALWLLDEPTVSLDEASVRRFVDAVETHLAQGGMALIATHIDLGLNGAQTLDISEFRAKPALDEAFL